MQLHVQCINVFLFAFAIYTLCLLTPIMSFLVEQIKMGMWHELRFACDCFSLKAFILFFVCFILLFIKKILRGNLT